MKRVRRTTLIDQVANWVRIELDRAVGPGVGDLIIDVGTDDAAQRENPKVVILIKALLDILRRVVRRIYSLKGEHWRKPRLCWILAVVDRYSGGQAQLG